MIPAGAESGEGAEFSIDATDLLPVDFTEVDAGVYVTPLLREAACRRLLEDVDRRLAESQRERRAAPPPNSMHDFGRGLEGLGMESIVDQLLDGPAQLRARVAELFPEVGGGEIDHHHSYFVDYATDRDEDLGFHVDDSEVTLNLCLGQIFRGAELVMLGRRCADHRQSPPRPDERVEIEHEPGTLVIHAGWHRHQVEPILRGRRRNLIAWLRSSAYRGAVEGSPPDCPAWCGERSR